MHMLQPYYINIKNALRLAFVVLVFCSTVQSAEAYITSFTSYPSGGYTIGQTITLSGTFAYPAAGAPYPTMVVGYWLDGVYANCWINPNYPGVGVSGTWNCTLPVLGPGVHSFQVVDVHNAPMSGYAWPMGTPYTPSTFTVYPAGSGPIPTVMTLSAANITSSSATLNGYADLRGLNSGMGWFRYDTNPSNLNCAADSGGTRTASYTFVDPFAGFPFTPAPPPMTTYSYGISISGLSVGTTYYYCAIAASANGIGAGTIRSFTPAPPPPTVQTVGHTIIDASSATLRARANPQGNESIGWLRYSTTNPGPSCPDTFGTRVPGSGGVPLGSGTNMVEYSVPISPLTLGTRYYYCAFASNSIGTGRGSVLSFTMALSNIFSENLILASGVLTEGQNVRFRATYENSSAVSTGAGFSNSFMYRWGTSGVWLPVSTHTGSSLSPGQSRTNTSNSLSLSSGGELQVQYCADVNSEVGESNESDNCIVETFTVTGSIPVPPIAPELSLSPRIVTEGETATLSWDTHNGNESLCTLIGGTLGANPLSPTSGDVNLGSVSIQVNARTTYTLACPHGSDTVTTEIIPQGFET